LKLAAWLAGQGAGEIILVGRSSMPARADWDAIDPASQDGRRIVAVRSMEAAGSRVRIVSADVASAAGMRDAFAEIRAQALPLRGVFHAAAAMHQAPILSLCTDDFARMFAAKVDGTTVLHELTAELPLDWFVLFSSTTALWGVAGLAHYAAANQFLDAFAASRRSAGLPALSVNWGTWDEMRLASEDDRRRFAQGGLLPMDSGKALAALAAAGGAARANVAVASVDWSAFKALYEARGARPFFERITVEDLPAPTRQATSAGVAAVIDQVNAAPPAQRRELVTSHISREVARILGRDQGCGVELDRGLFEMGMDSLMSVELKNALERAFGRRLPSTLTFNYPNVGALSQFICSDVLRLEDPGASETTAAPDAHDDLSEQELAAMLAATLGSIR
jgi:myxalamid-type polyketide synthase MxaE and MxaD